MTIARSPEAEAFIATSNVTDPRAVSACAGWTTHEVVAHVVGVAVEVCRHLEPFLHGDPVPTTRSFAEREAPLQAMDHSELLERLDTEETRMRGLVGDVLERDPDAVIPWTGRHMAVAKFVPHLRNEHVLHRWDVAGDDETSERLLGREDLVDHSVGELGEILLAAGREHDPEPDRDFRARLRSEGERDLLVLVEAGEARLVWADDDAHGADEAGLEVTRPARHLLIWGRRSDRRGQVVSTLPASELARLQALLGGY